MAATGLNHLAAIGRADLADSLAVLDSVRGALRHNLAARGSGRAITMASQACQMDRRAPVNDRAVLALKRMGRPGNLAAPDSVPVARNNRAAQDRRVAP